MPSILDGTLGDDDDLPTWGDHPRNLFTLLGHEVPVHRYESVTDLCPPTVCEPPPRQPLSQAIEDASVVYGHRVLPEALRDELPAIDNSWGAYGAEDDAPATTSWSARRPARRPTRRGQVAHRAGVREVARARRPTSAARSARPACSATMTAAIDGSPAVHFVHVALPHRPWVLSRTGDRDVVLSRADHRPGRTRVRLRGPHGVPAPQHAGRRRRHARRRARRPPAVPCRTWADTLLVVTSDHGTNLTPPDIGRMKVTDANREEVYRVPLFIKVPGQVEGEIRDDSVQNLDVLPSIVDLLGAEVDWEFDGHSLYDGSTAHTAPKVSTDVDAAIAIAASAARGLPVR